MSDPYPPVGYYVVRIPYMARMRNRESLIMESRCFRKMLDEDGFDRGRHAADGWRDWIQSEHPKDNVFVIEKLEPQPED